MKKSWIKDSDVRYVLEKGQHDDRPLCIVLWALKFQSSIGDTEFDRFSETHVISWSHLRHIVCSVYRNDNPILSSFMIYHRIYNKSNTTGVSSGAGPAFHSISEHLSSPLCFSGVRVVQFVVFCVVFCRSFCLLDFFVCLTIVLSVLLRFMASDYLFGIFKPFFTNVMFNIHPAVSELL